jgi:hypothetical protein
MKWDRRKNTNDLKALSTELPVDYIKLVTETMDTALAAGLAEVKKTHPKVAFYAGGAIYADEVLLAITLSQGDEDLFATTVYASADFNPLAEKPGIQLTLESCLDAAGAVYDFYLGMKHPEKVAEMMDPSLGAMEEAPFEWTIVDLSDQANLPVYVRIDKANPQLDARAEKWLEENDPEYQQAKAAQAADPLAGAEEFLEERLEAIKKAQSGSGSSGPTGPGGFGGGGQSGPITH